MTKESLESHGDQPATSCVGYAFNGDSYHQLGLTIREYFAAQAMVGLLSNPAQIDTTNYKWVAEHAVGYANALIEALAKKEKEAESKAE